MIVLIDNGHGSDTKGKMSPDGRLKEYAWTREIAMSIAAVLAGYNVKAHLLTPETIDIPLTERVRRVNQMCAKYGADNVLLISIHNNASGSDGKWHDAMGWSVYVAPNSSSQSRTLAQLLYTEAERKCVQGNRAVPPCKYWVGNFAIVRDTNCPAVLTENLFQDNKLDVDYLLSATGKSRIIALHVDAILKYVKNQRR